MFAPKLEPKMTAESAARRASVRAFAVSALAARMCSGRHCGTLSIILKTMSVAGRVSNTLQKSIVVKPET